MASLPIPSDLMKRAYQAICLVVLMIAAQHGAVVHELSHLAGAQSAQVRAVSGEATDSSCALCPAFAQASSPAFSHTFIIPRLARVEVERIAELRLKTANLSVPTPRSRGPPSQS